MRKLLVLGALALAGCLDGELGDDGGVGPPPDLETLSMYVFSPACAFGPCHTDRAAAGGLSLEGPAAAVRAALVDRPAEGPMDRVLVIPGQPNGSYLLEKLTEDAPEAGTRMPQGGGRLPAEQVAQIRRWIAAGAP
ncbi:MAG: hypothetical protein KC549_05745 [Myxococcales bacterium]|nr:hypothetical protein [Myxococcales bacterium]